MWSSLLYHAFHNFHRSDEQLRKIFEARKVAVQIQTYFLAGRQIRYAAAGKPGNPMVIFVHGAPGSLDAFANYLADPELLQYFHLISVDRPGFGASGYGDAVTSIGQQAAMLSPLLRINHSHQAPLLVGHSYGGPIIGKMAIDYPEQVGALLMLAPAVDPDLEKIFWISYPVRLKPIRILLPDVWKVTHEEKMQHSAELRDMQQQWPEIGQPTTVIQGQQDKIIHPRNAEFLERKMQKAEVNMIYHPRLNHMIPWKGKALVKKVIMEYWQ
jgi:pimeloyl-ACP methyl ester carboxylesterase